MIRTHLYHNNIALKNLLVIIEQFIRERVVKEVPLSVFNTETS